MLAQSTTLFEFYYTKGDIDTLLADEVFNIGDISLPGMLDIGTSAYTNPRIRCNAEVGGYTGYAELQAANSYDMFMNLSTTRTSGGWMYFKINNNSYMRLSGSDNKVNIYKDTTISGNLDVGSVRIDAGIYKMCKSSVGDTTAYETFNGNVSRFNLNRQTQMSFVACATNGNSIVNQIRLCCLNRVATYSSYTPAITFPAWG